MGRTNKDLIQVLINYSPLEKVLFAMAVQLKGLLHHSLKVLLSKSPLLRRSRIFPTSLGRNDERKKPNSPINNS